MRYFVTQDVRGKQPYPVTGLFRWEVTESTVVSERWVPDADVWVDHPDLIAMTGIGGDNRYSEIKKTAVPKTMRALNPAVSDAE